MWLSKTLRRSVKWFLHKKISLEPAEALERLLQNWTFIVLLSSKLQNTIFVWLHFAVSQHRSFRTQSWTLPKTSSTSAKDSYKEAVFTNEKNFYLNYYSQHPSCISNQNKCLSYREEVFQRASCVTHHRLASASVVGPYGLKDDCT